MKTVYIIGFRGVSFLDPNYKNEHPLLWVGHVGIAFEGHESLILGLHPTDEAINAAGGIDAAFEVLRNRQRLDGKLFNDTAIFVRADQLSHDNSQIAVWQMGIDYPDADFESIQAQALTWYNQSTVFPYSFPRKNAMPPDRDNCATFPRKLNLPIPETTGQLYRYIALLEANGQKWQPPKEIS